MARENGTTVRAIRVIVGKNGHETPIFSGEMETVVFSPYWNVPDSIAEDETAPAIRQDPGYLTRNQIEVVRRTKSGPRSSIRLRSIGTIRKSSASCRFVSDRARKTRSVT